MSKADNLHDFLQDVSDAIKEKKGSTEPINAQSFSEEIRNLPSGGEVAILAANMVSNGGGVAQIKNLVISEGVTMIDYRAFLGLQNLVKISLPNSITNFGVQAFQDCISLASLKVPPKIKNIQNMVFYGCKGLELVDCREVEQIPTLGSSVFANTNANLKIVVPDSLYNSWIASTNWSALASKIVKASEYVE